MKNYLGMIVAKAKSLLGPLWAFVPAILGTLKQALKAGDKAEILAVCQQIEDRALQEQEHAAAMLELVAMVREAVADDAITAAEFAAIAEQVQTVIDEAEDIVTGHDDTPTVPANPV